MSLKKKPIKLYSFASYYFANYFGTISLFHSKNIWWSEMTYCVCRSRSNAVPNLSGATTPSWRWIKSDKQLANLHQSLVRTCGKTVRKVNRGKIQIPLGFCFINQPSCLDFILITSNPFPDTIKYQSCDRIFKMQSCFSFPRHPK